MGFKKRGKSSLSLADKVESMTKKEATKDEAEWKLTVDKQGNGTAVIRFLPHKDEEKSPFVKMMNHGFKQNNRWFIENCPTVHGLDCPVCTANSELWDTDTKANKDIASNRKRKISYWANIVVISDKSNPDSEGKVFKYRFGTKILEKIEAHAKGNEELDEPQVNVDCVYDGANFALKAQKVDGYQNYDLSKFGQSKPLFGGDEDKLNEVFDAMHDIDAIADPKHFKSHEVLEKEFNTFIGKKGTKTKSASEELSSSKDDGEEEEDLDALLNGAEEEDLDALTKDEKDIKEDKKSSKEDKKPSKEAVDNDSDEMDDLDALLSEL